MKKQQRFQKTLGDNQHVIKPFYVSQFMSQHRSQFLRRKPRHHRRRQQNHWFENSNHNRHGDAFAIRQPWNCFQSQPFRLRRENFEDRLLDNRLPQ